MWQVHTTNNQSTIVHLVALFFQQDFYNHGAFFYETIFVFFMARWKLIKKIIGLILEPSFYGKGEFGMRLENTMFITTVRFPCVATHSEFLKSCKIKTVVLSSIFDCRGIVRSLVLPSDSWYFCHTSPIL